MELMSSIKKMLNNNLPTGWKSISFGEIAEKIIGGGTPSRSIKQYWGGQYPWVTVKDLTSFNPYQTEEYISKEGLNNSATHLIPKNTLITSTRMALGKAVIYNVDVCINQDIKAIFPKNKVDTKFLYYWFQNNSKQIEELGSGSTVLGLSLVDLKGISVILPPLPEQKAIAKVLSDTDNLIQALEKQIAKKRLIKQGAMQRLLSEEGSRTLGSICNIQKGQMLTSATKSDGSIPVIAGGKKPAYFHNVANRTGKTITISASGANAGYVSFHKYPIYASDCSTIGESDRYVIEFIYYLLQFKQETIYKSQTGGAQPHIHPRDLEPIMIPFPDLSEQTRISTLLSDMDSEIYQLDRKHEKYIAIKKGLMQNLLTGRIRIK